MTPTKHKIAARLRHRSEELFAAGKFSHSSITAGAARSLERFWKFKKRKGEITFADITQQMLKEYESWMLKHGKLNKSHDPKNPGTAASITTIGMYVNQIRFMYRQAMIEGLVKYEHYPFGNGGFTVPTESNTRQPRTKEEIQMIADYPCVDSKQAFLRDMWLFSYFSNGMNAKDICLLRWTNIDLEERKFVFVREKSRAKSKRIIKIEGVLFPKSLEIISRWGSTTFGNSYLFPIFTDSMTPIEMEDKKKYFILLMNKAMKQIGDDLGLKGDLRSYTARHSFTNHLLQEEVPMVVVSEALGHSKISTTEHYRSRFPSKQKLDYLSRLVQ